MYGYVPSHSRQVTININPIEKQEEHDVYLRVYDLSEGKAALISPVFMKNPVAGVWHSSIQAYGQEYFFGGYIDHLPPRSVERDIGMAPTIVRPLGVTRKSRKEFESFLKDIDREFTPLSYDLINWNCNHFADVCARFLLNNKGIPRGILRQPHRVNRSWFGRLILKSLVLAQENRNPFIIETQNPGHGCSCGQESRNVGIDSSDFRNQGQQQLVRQQTLSFRPPNLVQLEADRLNARLSKRNICSCEVDCDPFRWLTWLTGTS